MESKFNSLENEKKLYSRKLEALDDLLGDISVFHDHKVTVKPVSSSGSENNRVKIICTNSSAQKNAYEEEIDLLQKKLFALGKELQEKDNSYNSISNSQMEDEEKKMSQITQIIKEKEELIQSLKNEISTLSEENQLVKSENQFKSQESEKNKFLLQRIKNEIEDLKQENESLKQTLIETSEKIRKKSIDDENLKNYFLMQNFLSTKGFSSLEEMELDYQDKISSIHKDLQSSKKEINNLLEDRKVETGEFNVKFQQLHETLILKELEFESEKTRLEEKVNSLKKEINKEASKCTIYERNSEEFLIKDFQEKVGLLNQDFFRKENEMNEKIQNLQNIIKSLEEEKKEMKIYLNENSIQNLSKKIKDLENEKNSIEQQIKTEREESLNHNKRLEELAFSLENKQEELEKMHDIEVKEITAEVKQLKEKLEFYQNESFLREIIKESEIFIKKLKDLENNIEVNK